MSYRIRSHTVRKRFLQPTKWNKYKKYNLHKNVPRKRKYTVIESNYRYSGKSSKLLLYYIQLCLKAQTNTFCKLDVARIATESLRVKVYCIHVDLIARAITCVSCDSSRDVMSMPLKCILAYCRLAQSGRVLCSGLVASERSDVRTAVLTEITQKILLFY